MNFLPTQKITLRLLVTVFMLLATTSTAWTQAGRQDPFIITWSDEMRQVTPGQNFDFEVKFQVPGGHYLYDDKSGVKLHNLADFKAGERERPPAQQHYDEFFKKNLDVHFKDFTETIRLQVPDDASLGQRSLEGEIRYQGCSEDFCYRPIKRTIMVPVAVVAKLSAQKSDSVLANPSEDSSASATPQEKRSFWELIQENNPDTLLQQGRVTLLLLALVAGILTSFTPCVLPIIPLTLAFIGARRRESNQRWHNFAQALWLVLGMVLMYALLGFVAATLGLKLGFLFQSRYFVLATALFFLLFSLALFGVIPFQLPQSWQQKFSHMGGQGPGGAVVAGLTIGLVASPCVGPLIAPLLLIAARSQDRLYGFFLLLAYGVGMGLIFLVLATGWGTLQNKLKGGAWAKYLKNAMAILLLLPALWYGWAFAKPYLGPSADKIWVTDFYQGMELAKTSGKPVLLDYYADWCPPCIEMDQRTFTDSAVREMAASSFVMLKIDCSFDDENCQAATNHYEVIGWPTILFLHPNGEIMKGLTQASGFVGPKKMLQLMEKALERVSSPPSN